nr:7-cyano-7-deazaguanine synthase [Methanothrix sp.]
MKAVLIFSGGLDSTTLLYRMLDMDYEVEALTFNYA